MQQSIPSSKMEIKSFSSSFSGKSLYKLIQCFRKEKLLIYFSLRFSLQSLELLQFDKKIKFISRNMLRIIQQNIDDEARWTTNVEVINCIKPNFMQLNYYITRFARASPWIRFYNYLDDVKVYFRTKLFNQGNTLM